MDFLYTEDKAVPAPAPGCTLENGATLSDGDSSCPAPNVTAVCNSGVLEYKAHCEPITCANLIRGQDPCDCPFCGGKSATIYHKLSSCQLSILSCSCVC